MKSLPCFPLLIALSLTAAAQTPPPPGPPPGPQGPDLRVFLQLTQEQMDQIHRAQPALMEQINPLARTRGELQRSLDQEMQSGTPNPAVLGELMLKIRAVEKEIDTVRREHRARLGVMLTADQLSRLDPLRGANMLQNAAHQAISLNLIGPNERPGPQPLKP